MIMPFNLRHFGVYSMKKSFLDYERFNAQRAKFNHQISLHTPVEKDFRKCWLISYSDIPFLKEHI